LKKLLEKNKHSFKELEDLVKNLPANQFEEVLAERCKVNWLLYLLKEIGGNFGDKTEMVLIAI